MNVLSTYIRPHFRRTRSIVQTFKDVLQSRPFGCFNVSAWHSINPPQPSCHTPHTPHPMQTATQIATQTFCQGATQKEQPAKHANRLALSRDLLRQVRARARACACVCCMHACSEKDAAPSAMKSGSTCASTWFRECSWALPAGTSSRRMHSCTHTMHTMHTMRAYPCYARCLMHACM